MHGPSTADIGDEELEVGDRLHWEGGSGTVTHIECDEAGEPAALVVQTDEPIDGCEFIVISLEEVELERRVYH